GGSGWTDLIKAYRQLYSFSGMMAAAASGGDPSPAMLKSLASSNLRVPDLVIGFRLTKPDASAALKRVQTLLRQQLQGNTDLDKRLQWQKVGGSDFLVLALDGTQVPWERMFAQYRGQVDDLIAKLKAVRLTISLGVREGYLLLGMGESTDNLVKL